MIDIINDLVALAKGIEDIGGRAYRTFPQRGLAGKPSAVISCVSHSPRLMEDGREVIADLSYQVQLTGPSPTELDGILGELTSLYGSRNVILNGILQGYNPDLRLYTVVATYSATVDRRGCVFIRG